VTRLLPVSGAGTSVEWPKEELVRLTDCGIRHCRIPGAIRRPARNEIVRPDGGRAFVHAPWRLTIAHDMTAGPNQQIPGY
jgi:hypothetical protein